MLEIVSAIFQMVGGSCSPEGISSLSADFLLFKFWLIWFIVWKQSVNIENIKNLACSDFEQKWTTENE